MTTDPIAHHPHDPQTALAAAFSRSIVAVLGEEYAGVDPLIRPTANPELGDFQCNAAMGLAKQIGRPPRELAEEFVRQVELHELADVPQVAGPGFINIRLRADAIAASLEDLDTPALGISTVDSHHPVIIDLCGVNVAKQMHVGHLRSTIIGDSLARILERQGRTVLRENHLGDWGLPIAMVLHRLGEEATDLEKLTLAELDSAYREAQSRAQGDPAGLDAARLRHAGPHRLAELEAQQSGVEEARTAASDTLVALQQGDAETIAAWHQIIEVTMSSVYEALDLLNIDMGPDNNRGESFYREKLQSVVDYFEERGLSRVDDGATIVSFDDRDRPLLIRKRDGGFLYATSDLAAIRYRTQETRAQRCIYVVDARQRDHFRDVFDAARLAGWNQTPDHQNVELVHVPFGSILGPDKKPLKTRSGTTLTLASLLEEAVERGTREVFERSQNHSAPTHGLPEKEIRAIGRAVGIGAVKYADLSNDRIRDYTFDMDRMIAFEGDTGPYLQYAHARICSMLEKAESTTREASPFVLRASEERQLALNLLCYPAVVEDVGRSLEPHRLCGYLHDLAETFSSFYQACPVLRAADQDTIRSRIRLCDLTRRILADGLDLLGIEAPRRM